MRKDVLLPAMAVAGGAVCGVLRLWQMNTAYDSTTQLFRHGAPATLLLLAVLGVVTAALLLLCRGGRSPEDFPSAFGCPDTLYLTAFVVAGFLFLGAGLVGVLSGMEEMDVWQELQKAGDDTPLAYPASTVVTGVLCFPAGLATLLWGKAAYRGTLTDQCSALAPFLSCCGLVWTFSYHLNHGTDPVLLRYGFPLAAAGLLTLGHYCSAGYCFEKKRLYRTLTLNLVGGLLAVLSVADKPELLDLLLLCAFGLSGLTNGAILLRNTFGPPWPKRLNRPETPDANAVTPENS